MNGLRLQRWPEHSLRGFKDNVRSQLYHAKLAIGTTPDRGHSAWRTGGSNVKRRDLPTPRSPFVRVMRGRKEAQRGAAKIGSDVCDARVVRDHQIGLLQRFNGFGPCLTRRIDNARRRLASNEEVHGLPLFG